MFKHAPWAGEKKSDAESEMNFILFISLPQKFIQLALWLEHMDSDSWRFRISVLSQWIIIRTGCESLVIFQTLFSLSLAGMLTGNSFLELWQNVIWYFGTVASWMEMRPICTELKEKVWKKTVFPLPIGLSVLILIGEFSRSYSINLFVSTVCQSEKEYFTLRFYLFCFFVCFLTWHNII